MAPNAVLDSYATRLDATVDPNHLLGRLIWYSLSEVRVPHADFVALLVSVGLSTTTAPNEPSNLDVFRRVCSAIKHDKVATKNPDIFENYRLVEFRDDGTVTRRVVRERVDNKGRKLGFTELFDVVFDRDTSDLVFKSLHGFTFRPGSVAADIRDQIIDDYYIWQGCLNAAAIRSWIRTHILGLYATMVRPGGGIYFLKEAHLYTVEGLEALGERLADFIVTDGVIEFHSLPLIDDSKQRDMIQRAFEAETVDAVDELITEITGISKAGKKITSDWYAALVDQFQDLTARTHEYEVLLEQKLATTATRLDIFQQSLLNIRKNIKEKS